MNNPQDKPSRIKPLFSWLRDGGARTVGFVVSIVVVAGVAARVSYSHIRDITLLARQPEDVAAVLPLAVDGLLLASSLAIAQDKANGRQPRPWARFGFWFGAGISITCNIADTIAHSDLVTGVVVDMTAAAVFMLAFSVFVSALAPAILLVTTEIMARPGKPNSDDSEVQPVPTAAFARRKTDEERLEDARRRAGYYQMDSGQRAAWTREYNKRAARRKERIEAIAQVSPGHPPVVPTEAELAELVG